MEDRFTNLKIFFSIGLSALILFFVNGKIKFDLYWLKNIFRPQRKISSIKIDYNKILTDVKPEDSFVMANVEFAPIPPTLTPTPTSISSPTLIPTKYVRPTYILPTRKKILPTIKPTSTPIPPTAVPKQIGDLPVSDPLKQKYYGRQSGVCYTPEYFIRYYGGDVSPNQCYANVRANVEANLTTVSLLGRNLQVHKLAAPYFQAVGDELAKYQKDNKTFNFPSKTYTINTIGTYVFRCNTNASTGDSWDTCQSGCVIGTHAFGIAIDINWEENCNGCSNYDMPDEIVDAFERWGFRWGGRYKEIFGAKIDAMHFEYMYDLCKDVN